jgi:hypothetical protein
MVGATTADRKPNVSRWGLSAAFVGGVVAICFIFGWLFAIQVEKNPLRLDEVDYFRSISNLAEIGLPLFYAGEVNIAPERLDHLDTKNLAGRVFEFYRYKPETRVKKEAFFALVDGQSQYIFGMWHPPLYIYLASIAYRLFPLTPGNSELLRYFNLVFSIATMAGMVRLSAILYAPHYRIVAIGALALYALNSFNIRGSSLIDYSATLAPCVVVWFCIACVQAREHSHTSIGVVAATVLIFFTSFGVATAVLFGVALWAVVFRLRRLPWSVLGSLLLGSVAFVPLFWIVCVLLDLPFIQPFIYNFWRSGIKPSNPWMAGRVEMTIRYVALYSSEIGWLVVLGVSLLFLHAVLSGQASSEGARRSLLPVLIATTLLFHAYIGANAWGFMKYILYALPLLFIYLIGELDLIARGSSPRFGIGAVAFLVCVLMVQLYSTLAMLRHPGGNLYLSQDQGVVEAGRAVQSTAGPEDIILSPKDIAFFAERRFVDWFGWKLGDPAYFERSVQRYDIEHIAQRTDSYRSLPEVVLQSLDLHFPVRSEVGSFTLLAADR